MNDIYSTPEAELHTPPEATESGSIETAIAGQYTFNIGEVFSEAWQKTKGSKTKFIGAGLIYIGISIFIVLIQALPTMVLGESAVTTVIDIIMSVLPLFITTPLFIGLYFMGVRRASNGPIAVGQIFQYFGRMLPLVLGMFLLYLLLALGFILLVLPGIYLMVAYAFALPLMADKGLSPWQALEISRKAVTHRWFSFFAFLILTLLIYLISIVFLFIPLIWTFPWLMIAFGITYRNLFGYSEITN